MTVARPPQAREYSPFDITSHEFWSRPFDVRDQTFAHLHHRLHVRRKECRIPTQTVTHGLIEEDRDLVVRLLSDVHGFRLGERAEIHVQARVDARARDDCRHAVACA